MRVVSALWTMVSFARGFFRILDKISSCARGLLRVPNASTMCSLSIVLEQFLK